MRRWAKQKAESTPKKATPTKLAEQGSPSPKKTAAVPARKGAPAKKAPVKSSTKAKRAAAATPDTLATA